MTEQILRTLDKFDKLGPDGVNDLLQKSGQDFGAGLDPIRAALIVQFACSKGEDNNQTLANIRRWFSHAPRVVARMKMMVALESSDRGDGTTAFDALLNMRPNDDNTWHDGGRPKNIAWALDDMVDALVRK